MTKKNNTLNLLDLIIISMLEYCSDRNLYMIPTEIIFWKEQKKKEKKEKKKTNVTFI